MPAFDTTTITDTEQAQPSGEPSGFERARWHVRAELLQRGELRVASIRGRLVVIRPVGGATASFGSFQAVHPLCG
jgi:hypothetical protein